MSLLGSEKLARRADLSGLPFTTTRDLPAAPVLAGQSRAEAMIRLGAGLSARGFNIFVAGATQARIVPSLRSMLQFTQRPTKPPRDWVYVNNFSAPHKPTAIASHEAVDRGRVSDSHPASG